MSNSHCPDLDLTEATSPSPLLLTKDSLIRGWKLLPDCKIGRLLPLWASASLSVKRGMIILGLASRGRGYQAYMRQCV